MDERTEIAARVLQGILTGVFIARPKADPPEHRLALLALIYTDALRLAISKTPDPAPGAQKAP